jgi:hypothetical protein
MPIMFQPGVLASLWGGQVRSLADGLGVELDKVRERHETWMTPERIGNMIWGRLRGLVVARLVVPEPLDTRRERRALVDMITQYVDGVKRPLECPPLD